MGNYRQSEEVRDSAFISISVSQHVSFFFRLVTHNFVDFYQSLCIGIQFKMLDDASSVLPTGLVSKLTRQTPRSTCRGSFYADACGTSDTSRIQMARRETE